MERSLLINPASSWQKTSGLIVLPYIAARQLELGSNRPSSRPMSMPSLLVEEPNIPAHELLPVARDLKANRLLAALPPHVWHRWLAELEPIELRLGEVLYESGDQISSVFFPTTAIVSLLYVLEDGGSAEIAVVGNEGIVGIALFMGGKSTLNRAVAQSAGAGFRMKAAPLLKEFEHPPVMHLMLRYTQALVTQMSQTAVCNRHHSLDKQLCRWLLLSSDRLSGNELLMTQELIANMLGVRREGVTECALKLQRAGLISYSRGHIRILDRKGLEARSCECYEVVRREYDRLLPKRTSI